MLIWNKKQDQLYKVTTTKQTGKSTREKAETISRLRTEIAGEVNTDWTPINLEENIKNKLAEDGISKDWMDSHLIIDMPKGGKDETK